MKSYQLSRIAKHGLLYLGLLLILGCEDDTTSPSEPELGKISGVIQVTHEYSYMSFDIRSLPGSDEQYGGWDLLNEDDFYELRANFTLNGLAPGTYSIRIEGRYSSYPNGADPIDIPTLTISNIQGTTSPIVVENGETTHIGVINYDF